MLFAELRKSINQKNEFKIYIYYKFTIKRVIFHISLNKKTTLHIIKRVHTQTPKPAKTAYDIFT